ncbi:MAG: DUF599 family protein [Gammaproteobacteria bacterium]|nr:DUF599 family protein [Gammaproteobacteria bacterium]
MLSYFELSVVDLIAVLIFFGSWALHYYVVNYSALKRHTITHHMIDVRQQWMRNMISRDGAPIDALIQGSLQQGVLFFGSTSVLLIGALATGLGASDRAISILQQLPFATTQSATQWELKLLLVLFIFVFAFFKFAWSHRLFNYIILMIGAAPGSGQSSEEVEAYAYKLARLHALGATHFTTGLNAYFFALAAFAWFLNSWLFIAATVWVSVVLYRRAFRSKFLGILKS